MGRIYWIASYPKSGNTWMRTFLTNLVLGSADEPAINSLADIAPDENLARFHAPFVQGPIASASLADLAAARPLAQRRIAGSLDGFAFLKTHSVLSQQFGHPAIAPDVTAGAVYIVRNPLDVVVSYSQFRNWTIDQTIANLNEQGRILPRREHSYVMCGSWTESVSSWTHQPHPRLLVVRYEDLLADPAIWFGKVVQLMQIAADQERIVTAIRLSSFEALKSAERKAGFRERPSGTAEFFRSGVSGSWRDKLSGPQIEAVIRPNEVMMRKFAYWEPGFDS